MVPKPNNKKRRKVIAVRSQRHCSEESLKKPLYDIRGK